jgi:hypothetical protein
LKIYLRCKTCGAELQNPFDRKGETALAWIQIHTAYPHKLENTIQEIQIVHDIVMEFKKFD